MAPTPCLTSPVRSRLAPTPSGYVHLGNVLNFLLTWSITRIKGGHLTLRIDDFDGPRARADSVEDILATLDWLGLDIDHGPSTVMQWQQSFRQEMHFENYWQEIIQLSKERIYSCQCSRKQIFEGHPQGHYLGTCRNRAFDQNALNEAWRFPIDLKQSATINDLIAGPISLPWEEISGDIQLRRSDGIIGHHALSLLEDHRCSINFVVRGADLFPSSLIQQTLASQWWPEQRSQTLFLHHGLVTMNGAKLSKSLSSTAVANIRDKKSGPAQIFKLFGEKLNFKNAEKLTTAHDFQSALAEHLPWNYLLLELEL